MTFPGTYDIDCIYIACSSDNDYCLPAKATTTDDITWVKLVDLPINSGQSININSKIVAVGGNLGWSFNLQTEATNICGTVTVLVPIVNRVGDNTDAEVRLIAGTNVVTIQIKGAAATTIQWMSETCVIIAP